MRHGAAGKSNGNASEKSLKAGCGSAWLERLIWDQEVAGSNPVTPIEREIFLVILTVQAHRECDTAS